MQLTYESTANGGTAQYNGNINTMQWNTHINGTCGVQQLYRFNYDMANRLTSADHRTWNGSSWIDPVRYNESGITYDLNGNLKTYTRKGLVTAPTTFGTIDQLTYTYGDAFRPDRLTQMSDAGNATKGFVYTAAAAAYQYDNNGNMTQDNHKGFVIAYNYLNLPQTFTKGANVITMTYTADGEKLTKAVTGGGATRNYLSGIEYIGANLDAIYFSEGRCTPNGATTFYYDYTIKDHLGNARVNFRANGTAVTFLEDLHYYPFGMLMEGIGTVAGTSNKYRYNNQEMTEDFGLNLSDYGARFYDASIGRWWNREPLSDYFSNQSCYLYGANNPLSYVDLKGLLQFPPGKTILIDGKQKTFEDAFPIFTAYLKGGTAKDGTKFGLESFISSSQDVTAGLKVIGGYTDEGIKTYITTWGSGITITPYDFHNDRPKNGEANGETNGYIEPANSSTGGFNLDINLIRQFENATTREEQEAALLAVISTILHESIHIGSAYYTPSDDLEIGSFSRKMKGNMKIFYYEGNFKGNSFTEQGTLFESFIWHNGNWESAKNNVKQPINNGLQFQIELVKKQKKENVPKPDPDRA